MASARKSVSTGYLPQVGVYITPLGGVFGDPTSTARLTLTGEGRPEGVVTAPMGCLYVDTEITTGAFMWGKKSGSGNTGWKAVNADTGDRSISSLLNAPAIATVSGACRLRRNGDLVSVHLDVTLQSTWSSGSPVLTVPVGFRPSQSPQVFHNWSYNGSTAPMSTESGGDVRLWASVPAGSVRANVQWFTGDGWPSSLPGSAV